MPIVLPDWRFRKRRRVAGGTDFLPPVSHFFARYASYFAETAPDSRQSRKNRKEPQREMKRLSRSVRYLVQVILLAAAYLAVAMFGLAFAIPPGNATAVWPTSGMALAAVLLLGTRVWPGIWLGALLANSTTTVSLATAATIATGNTLEALLAVWLCRRWLPQEEMPFQRVEQRAEQEAQRRPSVSTGDRCLGGSRGDSG